MRARLTYTRWMPRQIMGDSEQLLVIRLQLPSIYRRVEMEVCTGTIVPHIATCYEAETHKRCKDEVVCCCKRVLGTSLSLPWACWSWRRSTSLVAYRCGVSSLRKPCKTTSRNRSKRLGKSGRHNIRFRYNRNPY
jgi:hypothetical protein